MTGGSSGGSGGAVAGGLVPLSLGSDTNGSIRVPSSLCGIFGLKPTYGRLSRAHTFPFVASLDHVGPLARSARDLALAYDAMQGHDPDDPVCANRPVEPATPLLDRGINGLRIAIAGGYFRAGAAAEARTALERVADGLGVKNEIEIPEARRARAAAYVITATEGAALHLDRLRKEARDFDPAVRDRLIAGTVVPSALVVKAQKFRRWYRDQMLALFANVDAILAPATPCTAPATRSADVHAGRCRVAGAGQSRHLHPTDFVHRAAGGRRAGTAQAIANWGPDHRGALAGGRGVAGRARAGDAGDRCRHAAAESTRMT